MTICVPNFFGENLCPKLSYYRCVMIKLSTFLSEYSLYSTTIYTTTNDILATLKVV
jgi:hypothetical protein